MHAPEKLGFVGHLKTIVEVPSTLHVNAQIYLLFPPDDGWIDTDYKILHMLVLSELWDIRFVAHRSNAACSGPPTSGTGSHGLHIFVPIFGAPSGLHSSDLPG